MPLNWTIQIKSGILQYTRFTCWIKLQIHACPSPGLSIVAYSHTYHEDMIGIAVLSSEVQIIPRKWWELLHGYEALVKLQCSNFSYTERNEVTRDPFPPSALRNFQRFSFCGTVYFLSLSCIFSVFLTLSPLFLYHLPIHFFFLLGSSWCKRNIPLYQTLEDFIFSRSSTGHCATVAQLYNSVAPVTDLGEVPLV